MAGSCLACGSDDLDVFHEQHGIPTNSCLLLPTRDEAVLYPRGDLVLALCHSCGFISNSAFDPSMAEYSGRYEETQAYSATFGFVTAVRMTLQVMLQSPHFLYRIERGGGPVGSAGASQSTSRSNQDAEEKVTSKAGS